MNNFQKLLERSALCNKNMLQRLLRDKFHVDDPSDDKNELITLYISKLLEEKPDVQASVTVDNAVTPPTTLDPTARSLVVGEEISLNGGNDKIRVDSLFLESEDGDTILYYGTIVSGKNAGKKVMIKLQPRGGNNQVADECHFLTRIKKHGSASLLAQSLVGYVTVREAYVLASGLLGKNLLQVAGPDGKHSVRNMLIIMTQALVLIEELHKLGVSHRDIKPENFVLGSPGTDDEKRIHLIDFGTSKHFYNLRDGQRVTEPQDVAGTRPYMAPSVHQEKPPGQRDDIASLVYVILRFLIGKLPWEIENNTLPDMYEHKLRLQTDGVHNDDACQQVEGHLCDFFDKCLAHVQALSTPESLPDYAKLREYAHAAWESSGLPGDPALAQLDCEI